MPPEGFLRLHADGQGLAALLGDLVDLLDAVSGVAGGSSLPLAILLVPASTNTSPTCGRGQAPREAPSGATTGTGGSDAPSLLALADLPAGEASAEPVVHGRGRDLSDTGPTTEGPVVDTLLSDGADEAR